MQTKKERTIRSLALFSECSSGDITWIAAHADEIDIPAGRTLAYEGETVREFIVVVDGACAAADGMGDVLLGRGSWYGEVGLLSDERHNATVETRSRARLLVFGVPAFRGLLDRAPTVRERLLRALSTRVREIDQESLSLRAVS